MNWTEEQRTAVETVDRSVCVDAGAGSGKTRVLIDHIAHLIQHKHATLDEIVAITFTDKAATEMKERLRKTFHQLGNAAAERESQAEQTAWRGLERRVEMSRISTIHAFCMALLKENALALGMDPDFGILSDADGYFLVGDVIEEGLHALLDAGDEAAMRLAAEYGVSRLMDALRALLKKRPVMEGVLRREHYGDPAALLRYWEECRMKDLRHRLEEFGAAADLHARRLELTGLLDECTDRRDKLATAGEAALRALGIILDGSDPVAGVTAAGVFADVKLNVGSKRNWHSPEALVRVKEVLGCLRDVAKEVLPKVDASSLNAPSAQLTCELATVYANVAERLEQAKQERTACDFDDLILRTLHILRTDADVRRRTAGGIRHLLIDEFQDTDHRQLEIARLLSEEQDGPTLFIVGDAKQSIYRFRGAEVEVFDAARREHTESVVKLDRNFRSRPDVLEFVNDFFRHSDSLRDVEQPYGGLKAHREALSDSRIEFLIPETIDGGKVKDYREAEARLIARRIRELHDAGDAAFGDVAILFRALGDAPIYEKALRDHGVDYALTAGTGFYERQEIMDLRNLLTVVVDPWDEMALLGFLRGPLVGMSDDALARLKTLGRLSGLFHAETPPSTPEADLFERGRALIQDCRRHSEMPVPAFIRHVLDVTKYEAVALSQYLGLQKASNVRKLVDLAEGFARSRTPRLSAFVRYLDGVAGEQIREGEASLQAEGGASVTLMTIHKSKGLEFPVVVVPDMSRTGLSGGQLPVALDREYGLAAKVVDGRGELKPSSQGALIAQKEKALEEAESARVLYVALTRAKERLLLGGAPNPRKGSWLARFNEQYHLDGREDGDTFSGKGWRALVRRRMEGATAAAPARDVAPVALADVKARAEPVAPACPSGRTISVTRLLKLMTDNDMPDERDEEARARNAALERGNLAHAMFEQWDFRAPVEPVVSGLVQREGCPVPEHEDFVQDMIRLARRVRSSSLGARLAEEEGVLREAPFLLCVGEAVVVGVIDAMLPDGTIIDYKTGGYSGKKHEAYEMQLRLYAAAVRRLLGIEPPEALLCYVDSSDDAGLLRRVDVSPARIDATLSLACDAIEAHFGGIDPAAPMPKETQ